jgi:hypothetical protein
MADEKRHTRFIEEELAREHQVRSSPIPQSTARKLVAAREQSPAPPSRFPVKPIPEGARGKLVPVLVGSPWKNYESQHRLKLGYSFAIAISTSSRLPRMIRSITGPSTDEQIQRLHRLSHANIVETIELYTCPQAGYFLVSEYLPTSVQHLCQAPRYPTEPQLSSILHQVYSSPGDGRSF